MFSKWGRTRSAINTLSFPNSLSLSPPSLERRLELKFMRGCLPPGKCYAAVITYILAGLYGKSRTGRPLAAFNHHYTLTRFLRLARFSSLLNPYSPRIKVKICTRQPGWEPRPVASHENRCSFYIRIGQKNWGDFRWKFPLYTVFILTYKSTSIHMMLFDLCLLHDWSFLLKKISVWSYR